MGIARNIARLIPNGSGLLPNANIEAMAASKLTGSVALATQVSGTLPDANAPSGSVIQVVHTTFNTPFSTNSSSYSDIGLSLSITPISTSSKILVLARIPVRHVGYQYASIRWLRNSTVISQPNTEYETGVTTSGADIRLVNPYMILDAPALTSSITYKAQAQSFSGTFEACPNSNIATLTLMEIAG